MVLMAAGEHKSFVQSGASDSLAELWPPRLLKSALLYELKSASAAVVFVLETGWSSYVFPNEYFFPGVNTDGAPRGLPLGTPLEFEGICTGARRQPIQDMGKPAGMKRTMTNERRALKLARLVYSDSEVMHEYHVGYALMRTLCASQWTGELGDIVMNPRCPHPFRHLLEETMLPSTLGNIRPRLAASRTLDARGVRRGAYEGREWRYERGGLTKTACLPPTGKQNSDTHSSWPGRQTKHKTKTKTMETRVPVEVMAKIFELSLQPTGGFESLQLNPEALCSHPDVRPMSARLLHVHRDWAVMARRGLYETVALADGEAVPILHDWFPFPVNNWDKLKPLIIDRAGVAETVKHFAFRGSKALRRLPVVAAACHNVRALTLINVQLNTLRMEDAALQEGGWRGPTEVRLCTWTGGTDELEKLRYIAPEMDTLTLLPAVVLHMKAPRPGSEPFTVHRLLWRTRCELEQLAIVDQTVPVAIRATIVEIVAEQREQDLIRRLQYFLRGVTGVEEFYLFLTDEPPWMHGRVFPPTGVCLDFSHWRQLKSIKLRFHYTAAIVIASALATVDSDMSIEETALEIFVSDRIGAAPEIAAGLDVALTAYMRDGMRAVLATGGFLKVEWIGLKDADDESGYNDDGLRRLRTMGQAVTGEIERDYGEKRVQVGYQELSEAKVKEWEWRGRMIKNNAGEPDRGGAILKLRRTPSKRMTSQQKTLEWRPATPTRVREADESGPTLSVEILDGILALVLQPDIVWYGMSQTMDPLLPEARVWQLALKMMRVNQRWRCLARTVIFKITMVADGRQRGVRDNHWAPLPTYTIDEVEPLLVPGDHLPGAIRDFGFHGMEALRLLGPAITACWRVKTITLREIRLGWLNYLPRWLGPQEVRLSAWNGDCSELHELRRFAPQLEDLTLMPGSVLYYNGNSAPFEVNAFSIHSRWMTTVVGAPARQQETSLHARRVTVTQEMRDACGMERVGNMLSGVFGVEEFEWYATDEPPWRNWCRFIERPAASFNLSHWAGLKVIRARLHYYDCDKLAETLKTTSTLALLEQTSLEIFIHDRPGWCPEVPASDGVRRLQQGLRAVLNLRGTLMLMWLIVSHSPQEVEARQDGVQAAMRAIHVAMGVVRWNDLRTTVNMWRGEDEFKGKGILWAWNMLHRSAVSELRQTPPEWACRTCTRSAHVDSGRNCWGKERQARDGGLEKRRDERRATVRGEQQRYALRLARVNVIQRREGTRNFAYFRGEIDLGDECGSGAFDMNEFRGGVGEGVGRGLFPGCRGCGWGERMLSIPFAAVFIGTPAKNAVTLLYNIELTAGALELQYQRCDVKEGSKRHLLIPQASVGWVGNAVAFARSRPRVATHDARVTDIKNGNCVLPANVANEVADGHLNGEWQAKEWSRNTFFFLWRRHGVCASLSVDRQWKVVWRMQPKSDHHQYTMDAFRADIEVSLESYPPSDVDPQARPLRFKEHYLAYLKVRFTLGEMAMVQGLRRYYKGAKEQGTERAFWHQVAEFFQSVYYYWPREELEAIKFRLVNDKTDMLWDAQLSMPSNAFLRSPTELWEEEVCDDAKWEEYAKLNDAECIAGALKVLFGKSWRGLGPQLIHCDEHMVAWGYRAHQHLYGLKFLEMALSTAFNSFEPIPELVDRCPNLFMPELEVSLDWYPPSDVDASKRAHRTDDCFVAYLETQFTPGQLHMLNRLVEYYHGATDLQLPSVETNVKVPESALFASPRRFWTHCDEHRDDELWAVYAQWNEVENLELALTAAFGEDWGGQSALGYNRDVNVVRWGYRARQFVYEMRILTLAIDAWFEQFKEVAELGDD
ncbi:hypothetical protein BDZ89DRAFT_1044883 [Hymenopellis radicata]|nr:hypothetical protein BDZ89DRAFT_1044883 [Hymenopellis radicata]